MYDPRDDQELRDLIEAALRAIDPDFVLAMDDRNEWLLSVGDQIPLEMYPSNAVKAGYDAMFVSFVIHVCEQGYNIGWDGYRPGGNVIARCLPCCLTDREWTRSKDEIYARAIDTLDTLRWWVNGREWNNRG